MDKETSSRISTIASRLTTFRPPNLIEIVDSQDPDRINEFCADVRALAGSALSQDETPGQSAINRPAPDFYTRLKDEREDLDRRLVALNSYLTHNPGNPSPRHYKMLEDQSRLMSDLLAVLDERIADIEISRRSENGND